MRKKKAMILTVGLISIILLSACAKESSAEPIVETVTSEEIHTESESLTSEEERETESFTSKTETTEEDSVRYGEYGEGMYNALVDLWKDWTILDEAELRVKATSMLGLIAEEDYEAIITEILSLDRGTNPYITPDTQQVAKDNSNNSNGTQPVTQPAPAETQATPPETQAVTQPAPPETQAPPQNNDSDLAEGALSIEEIERRKAEAGMTGHAQGEEAQIGGWSGPGTWNWN